jgi:hypothetical protein
MSASQDHQAWQAGWEPGQHPVSGNAVVDELKPRQLAGLPVWLGSDLGQPNKLENRNSDDERMRWYFQLGSDRIGALLGLSDWRLEAAHVGAHAAYLARKYWRTEISVSFPRMRECPSAFKPHCAVTDRELVQMLFALRLYTKFGAWPLPPGSPRGSGTTWSTMA